MQNHLRGKSTYARNQQIIRTLKRAQLHICLQMKKIFRPLVNLLERCSPGSSSDSDSFSSSDNEPLSKYRKRKSSGDEGHSTDTTRTPSRSVGRPRGRAKPPAKNRNRHFRIVQKNIRCDGVDEECTRLGIYYKKWRPLNPDQTSHISVRDGSTSSPYVTSSCGVIPPWYALTARTLNNMF